VIAFIETPSIQGHACSLAAWVGPTTMLGIRLFMHPVQCSTSAWELSVLIHQRLDQISNCAFSIAS